MLENGDQIGMRDNISYTPACHHEVFREAVQCDRAVCHTGQCTHGDERTVIEVPRVDLICHGKKIILLREACEHLQRRKIVSGACRIIGCIDNESFRPGSDGGTNVIFLREEAVFGESHYFHGLPAGHLNLVLVRGKVRAKYQDFIAGVQQPQHGLRHTHAAGSGDQYFIRGDCLVIVFFPGFADRFDQFRITFGIAIACISRTGVFVGSIDDSPVGDDIGIADAQVDHIRIAPERFRIQRQGTRMRLESVCSIFQHG